VLDILVTHVDGRVPVVAGTTAEGLPTRVEYTRRACRRSLAERTDP
jgi:dihydrodipicolinate synthase/N-acetylneuraminate lyase